MKKLVAMVLAVCMLMAMTSMPAMARGTVWSAETSLYGSSGNKIHNIELAIECLDGTIVPAGGRFSFNEVIGRREKEDGYLTAKNGRGSKVMAGGVSQLATTLLLAARDSGEVEFEPYWTYDDKFTDWYVESGYDAVITDYKAGHDLAFTNYSDEMMYISAWIDEDSVYVDLEFGDPSDWGGLVSRASTPLYGSKEKLHNIEITADAISGWSMEAGEEFSFNDIVGPRTKEAGYRNAVNGRGSKVMGGGVAQVASTLYLALKELDSVSIDPFKTYGEKFSDGYVIDPAHAVVTDYKSGHDFSFVYWGDDTLTIELYSFEDRLICEVYED